MSRAAIAYLKSKFKPDRNSPIPVDVQEQWYFDELAQDKKHISVRNVNGVDVVCVDNRGEYEKRKKEH